MSIKGTRDFYPEDFKLRKYLFSKFEREAELAGFEQYDTPVVEKIDLWKEKGGDEIMSQMFTFTYSEGGGGEDISVCLRPEITPCLGRIIKSRIKSMKLPAKLFTIGQCWRLETIQLGRKREHHQWNVDIVGGESFLAEVEVISVMINLFKSLGLTNKDVKIRISDRRIIENLCKKLDISFEKTCKIIDKTGKITNEQRRELFVEELGFIPENLEKFIDGDGGELDENGEDVKSIISLLEGEGSWCVFDPSIVRGLSYYTGIVFEAYSTSGKFRAIAGGGRYNIAGISSCGFGFGDCVIWDVLKEHNCLPPSSPTSTLDVFVIGGGDGSSVRKMLNLLRSNGIKSSSSTSSRKISLKASLKLAASSDAKYALILFEDSKEIIIKNLKDPSDLRGKIIQDTEQLIDKIEI